MKARSRFAIITTTLAALSISALASADMKNAGDGGLEFSLPGGTAGLKIEGKSSDITANETGGKVTIVVKIDCGETACLKTGIDKRDEHLAKALEAKKFPTATMTVDKSKLSLPEDGKETEGDTTGQLKLHGVTNSVPVHYHVKRTGSDYHVRGTTKFTLEEFKIEQPSFAGVTTGKELSVKVKFKLREG
ncbi:MAG: YceI family protein [Polyangiaceae bacterium]